MTPRARSWTVTLSDGSRVVLRAIEPTDREALAAAHEKLSPDSRYKRFLSPMPRLTEAMLTFLTDVDHHDHEAIIAMEPDSRDGLGVARYVRSREDPEEAEVAFAVIDDWQGRGLGRALLDRLVGRAREEGVRRITGLGLAGNVTSFHMLEGVGDAVRTTPSAGNVQVCVELGEEEGLGEQLTHVLRATAAGSLVAVGAFLHRAVPTATPGSREARPDGPRSIERIVVGTDGSRSAGRAVREAATLARALDAQLRIVSAYALPVSGVRGVVREVPAGLSDVGWMLASRGDAQEATEAAAALAREQGAAPDTEVRRGDPASALLEAAEEHEADLIVVGSKGLRGARRFLLGAVADRIARHAPCNVLIVRTT